MGQLSKKKLGGGGKKVVGCQIFKYVKVIVKLGCLFSHGEAETYYLTCTLNQGALV